MTPEEYDEWIINGLRRDRLHLLHEQCKGLQVDLRDIHKEAQTMIYYFWGAATAGKDFSDEELRKHADYLSELSIIVYECFGEEEQRKFDEKVLDALMTFLRKMKELEEET